MLIIGKQRLSITGSSLKIIALACMLVDHIASAILGPLLDITGPWLAYIYLFLRLLIGRTAFPIFCFLLVEGFQHTSNRWKYTLRLFLFALISEIPFDIALNGAVLEFHHQNVFFTLTIGMLAMISYRKIGEMNVNRWMRYIYLLVVICSYMTIATAFSTDYGAFGILLITVLYFLRGKRGKQILGAAIAIEAGGICLMGTVMEVTAPLGLIPCKLYNGKRGLKLKYVFYAFYPVHLLILGIIRWVITYYMIMPLS